MCASKMTQNEPTSEKNTSNRLRSIDFLRGFSMLFILYHHFSMLLLGPGTKYFEGLIWIFIDFFGPAMFITISCLSVSISILQKRNKIKQGHQSALKTILKRSLVLWIIGIVFILNYEEPDYGLFDPAFLFRMQIFQLIAVSQIITYFALKLKISVRITIIALIIVIDYLFYPILISALGLTGNLSSFSSEYLVGSEAGFAWIYMLFFRADADMAIFPWIIIPFIISIVGEYIFKNYIKKQNKNDKTFDINSHIKIIYTGLILILIGIITGLGGISEYRQFPILEIINFESPVFVEVAFTFFFRGSVPNLIYSIGLSIFMLGITLKFLDFREIREPRQSDKGVDAGKNSKSFPQFDKFVENISLSGKFSLTLFVMHNLLFFIHPINLIGFVMLPVNFFLIYLNIKILLLWIKKGKGKYTFEYFIRKIV